MRVSTKTFQLQWLSGFNQRQVELLDIQRQVSTGRRLATAKDDPAGAAQVVLLEQGLERLENYSANAETARRRLSLGENALNDSTDILNRVRELAVQAGDGAQSPESRASIANEARELLRNLLDVANSQDGEGRYLFGGNRVKALPFAANGSNFTYQGDSGGSAQRIGDNRVVEEGLSGAQVFAAIRNGNGTFSVSADPGNNGSVAYSAPFINDPSAWVADNYSLVFTTPDTYEVTDSSGVVVQSGSFSPGDSISFAGVGITLTGEPEAGDQFSIKPSANQSVFDTVQKFIDALDRDTSSVPGKARTYSALNSSLTDLDQALGSISDARSILGSRLSVIDQQLESNVELDLQYKQTISTVRDVDYASAISELEQQLLGLEAAQKTYSRTRAFSLFSLI
jgi:flagellar hook-associated protein 3 FlgL